MEVLNSLKKHRKPNTFLQIDRAIINDFRLSWKAKGLLMYLLDQSDSWQFYQTEICRHGPDGRSSVASGLKELEEAGYLKRTWIRDAKGKYTGRIWEVYEDPTEVEIHEADMSKEKEESQNPHYTEVLSGCRKPDIGKPDIGFSDVGKPATNNNKYNNNNNNKREEEEKGLATLEKSDLSEPDSGSGIEQTEIFSFSYYTGLDMSSRASRDMYAKWFSDWKFSHEMIRLAGKLMIQLAKVPNLSYIDQVLSNWKSQNIKTTTEAEKAIREYRKRKQKSSNSPHKRFANQEEYEIYVPPERPP